MKTPRTRPVKPSRRGWLKCNLRTLRTLLVDLPRYLSPAMDGIRELIPPSKPHLVLGRLRWYSMQRHEWPVLHVRLSDGYGERYGYPRHELLLVLWWRRRGYAFGVEWRRNDKENNHGNT